MVRSGQESLPNCDRIVKVRSGPIVKVRSGLTDRIVKVRSGLTDRIMKVRS